VSLYGSVVRGLLAPTMDLIRGTHTMSCLRELEESQWWPCAQLHELQSERLRQLITHAYKHVPYYRRTMDERGIKPSAILSAADLQRLPVLTRELVRCNFEDLIAENIPRNQLRAATTGGSTGTPLSFCSTTRDQQTHGFARGIRALEFAGVSLGDRRILIRIARQYSSRRARSMHRLSRRIERVVELDSRDITLQDLPSIAALLGEADMHCLTGYPSAVAYIAAWIRASGLTPPTLDTVVTGGEQLFEHQRERIRDVFHVEPYSKYSCQEVFEIAMECGAHSGLHVAAEDIVLEIADDADGPASPGNEGRVLLTNLQNYGMPFIRYENGDSGTLVADACSCGRSLPLLSQIVGRRFDVIHTPSGRRIAGSNLGSGRLARFPVQQFQFLQDDIDHVTVRVVPRAGTAQTKLEEMRLRIPPLFNEIIGDDVQVDIEFCERIELTAAGKHLLVISKVDPDSWLKRLHD
jgi:phenylacetate-CoA ligase